MFFKKKDKKLSFTIQDIDYINQYLTLKFDKVKFYKNIFFMIIKNKNDFFNFISILDKNYLKKSSLIYITWDDRHNKWIFNKETNDILSLEINKELLVFLKVKIQNGRLFQKIDTEYKWLFKSKWTIFWVFIFVLFIIIQILWSQFKSIKEEAGGAIWVNMDSVFFFYEYSVLISVFFFSIVFGLMVMKYIKHLPFMEYNFSKYYVLLKYKERLYFTLIQNYIDKKWKTWEITYLNTKKSFNAIYTEIFPYLSGGEISELLFFLENDEVDVKIKNPLLKQDLIMDYKQYKYIQNNNVKEKMVFYEGVKDKNFSYYELLKLSFESEIEKLKAYMNLKWLFLYIVVTLVVMFMIGPVLLSAL